jgi:hypothetical protein
MYFKLNFMLEAYAKTDRKNSMFVDIGPIQPLLYRKVINIIPIFQNNGLS